MLFLFLLQTAGLSGMISSSHFEKLEGLYFQAFPNQKAGAFSEHSVELNTKNNSAFDIQFFKADIFSLYVTAPGHRYLTFNLFFDRPEKVLCDIRLPISSLDSGEFFGDPEYVKWIRVSGNFNDFDYETGIPFTSTGNPGEIAAEIPASNDTIWYKITGLSNDGTSILPGAEFIKEMGSNVFVGGIYNPGKPVRLVYDAKSWPNKRTAFENTLTDRALGGEALRQILKTENVDWLNAQIELVELQRQESGFARNPQKGTYSVYKDLRHFEALLDSLTVLVSAFPRVEKRTTYQKVVQMRYVTAVLQRLEIELAMGDKAPGKSILKDEKSWNRFKSEVYSIPPASPLWMYSLSKMRQLPVISNLDSELEEAFIEAVSRLSYDHISLDLFESTVSQLIQKKQKKSAKKWLSGMEKRFPHHFKMENLKTQLKNS